MPRVLYIESVWITPALTEASKSAEVVKTEEDTMVAKRTSDDWPTLTVRTLQFNALLSRQYRDPHFLFYRIEAWISVRSVTSFGFDDSRRGTSEITNKNPMANSKAYIRKTSIGPTATFSARSGTK